VLVEDRHPEGIGVGVLDGGEPFVADDGVRELAHAAPVAEVLSPGAVGHTTAFPVDDDRGDESEEILVGGGSGGASVSEANEVAGRTDEADAEEAADGEGGRRASVVGGKKGVVNADAFGVEGHRPVVSVGLRADNVLVARAFLPATETAASR
jgi:hypothetical protein